MLIQILTVTEKSDIKLILLCVCVQSVELDLKHDCKPLMERINVFKAAFSENEDDER